MDQGARTLFLAMQRAIVVSFQLPLERVQCVFQHLISREAAGLVRLLLGRLFSQRLLELCLRIETNRLRAIAKLARRVPV